MDGWTYDDYDDECCWLQQLWQKTEMIGGWI